MTILATQSADAQQPEIGTVQALTAGDRACYVDLIDEAGEQITELAAFEICQQDLVGQQVQLSYETVNILAASCQGNPDCGETETVRLISQAEVIEPPVVVTVQGLTAGDRACYIDVVDRGGVYSTQYADFAICEQDLIGKDVTLIYEPANILAASCQGNLDCGESETVMLVSQVDALELPTVGTVYEILLGESVCELGFADTSGDLWYREATFEVCDQDLMDQTVQFTYEVAEIPAYSCAEDPTCTETDFVTLITQAEPVSEPTPDPIDDIIQSTIEVLPDGNYRYWSAMPDGAIVSDDDLLASGGVTFTFRKMGNDITGILGYVDGKAICLDGRVNGNTVSGLAVQTLDGATVISDGETFAPFGPAGYLQVRRGFEVSPGMVQYNSALLNLTGLNRINAGTRVPPSDC
ncbi:hypothetical protein C7271_16260 [filamentous cyanobacterium CCP5]|nr:hypothetical protein C7271_16260 [filamentous cyanobacterium CCP5]